MERPPPPVSALLLAPPAPPGGTQTSSWGRELTVSSAEGGSDDPSPIPPDLLRTSGARVTTAGSESDMRVSRKVTGSFLQELPPSGIWKRSRNIPEGRRPKLHLNQIQPVAPDSENGSPSVVGSTVGTGGGQRTCNSVASQPLLYSSYVCARESFWTGTLRFVKLKEREKARPGGTHL